MRIVVPDDYQGAVAQLPCLQQMQGHPVQVLGALGAELDNVLAFAAGTPRNLVNPEVLATTQRV